MIFKLKKNSSIRKKGLYDLEKIFGEHSVRSLGLAWESIYWYLTNHKKISCKVLEISQENNNEILVSIEKYYPNGAKDAEQLNVEDMPKKWQNKFKEFVKTHCISRGKLL